MSTEPPRSESTISGDAPFTLTPLMVAERTMRSERYALDVLDALGRAARLGLEPGTLGVIVFPAGADPYFDAGEKTPLHTSGDAEQKGGA